jgi:uncharacterized phage protein gp47/JayE
MIGSITVANPTVLSVYVSATITLAAGYTLVGVSPAIKAAVENYMKSIPIGDAGGTSIVRFNKVSAAILAITGVIDLANLKVDSISPPVGTVNLVLADGQVAQTDDAKITLT